MKQFRILAHETDPDDLSLNAIVIKVEVTRDYITDETGLRTAIRSACDEYAGTDAGRAVLEDNYGGFNWADLTLYLPEDICMKHGFRITESCSCCIEADLNEQLVSPDLIP